MKRITFILTLVLAFGLKGYSQTTPVKEMIVESKTSSRLQFADINVSGQGSEYKSLCIKYISIVNNDQGTIDVNGSKFKFFQDKKSAISYYYKARGTAPSRETYYVYSVEKKNPEVLSIRA